MRRCFFIEVVALLPLILVQYPESVSEYWLNLLQVSNSTHNVYVRHISARVIVAVDSEHPRMIRNKLMQFPKVIWIIGQNDISVGLRVGKMNLILCTSQRGIDTGKYLNCVACAEQKLT